MILFELFGFVFFARLSGPRPYKMTDDAMRELFQSKASYSSPAWHKFR